MYRFDVENRLKAAEDKYFRLSENAADMIFSQDTAKLNYRYVNASALKITGYTPEEYYENRVCLIALFTPSGKSSICFQSSRFLNRVLRCRLSLR